MIDVDTPHPPHTQQGASLNNPLVKLKVTAQLHWKCGRPSLAQRLMPIIRYILTVFFKRQHCNNMFNKLLLNKAVVKLAAASKICPMIHQKSHAYVNTLLVLAITCG